MDISELDKVYTGQDLKVTFACFEADGTTPFNLATGYFEFTLYRTGVHAFELVASTDDGVSEVVWTNRAAGTGTLKIPLRDVDLPRGLARVQARAVDGLGRAEIQKIEWVRIIPTV